ncbi:MAG: U32 family peptidase [Defluviitaleaceae bacterium]|nr:U32 family peptidase [Defluviitaleaceae bacterium]
MNKVELLAPAGDFERLRVAVAYGADAVYMGGTVFGLRAAAKNFDGGQMARAIEYAQNRGVKVYVTANIFAHNRDIDEMSNYLREVADMGADALIVSDPGVFDMAREVVPQMELHISTQANNTNYRSALFWSNLGAKRIILARELSLLEIAEIAEKTRGQIGLEAFVHGSMCVAYSGRCLLSTYMNNRNANKGECSNNCRFKYALVEELRPGEYFPIAEDTGSYILNSKDLCMIEHIPALIESGLCSLKIEGRMKTPYYVATVTAAYRAAIDDFYADPERYEAKKADYLAEVLKSANRDFSTGFYMGKPENGQVLDGATHRRTYDFVGIVREYDEQTGMATIEQRNKFVPGDDVEFFRANGENFWQKISEIYDTDGNVVEAARHAQQILRIRTDKAVAPLDIMRKNAE